MTVLITPANGPWAATLNIPADGEAISSVSVLGYMQEVANRLEYLRQRVPGANPVANLIRQQKSPGSAVLVTASTTWVVSTASNIPGVLTQISIAPGTESVFIPLDGLIAGQVIRAFNVTTKGAGGHAALPAVMPKVDLVKYDLSAAIGGVSLATTTVDTQTDVAANTAALQVYHAIGKTLAAPETVLANVIYGLRITGESGANSVAGANYVGASIDVSA